MGHWDLKTRHVEETVAELIKRVTRSSRESPQSTPSSMRAALENFAAMVSDLPKLAVLGGMKELGSESENEHGNVVQLVTELGLTAIYIGPEFEGLQDSAPGLVHMDVDSALRALTARPVTGHLVLMKGSRGTRLETLVPAF